MSNTQVVGDMSEWVGMMKDFWRQVGDGSLTKESFQTYLEHCDPFAITDIRREWQEFYRKYFRMNVDFSDVIIPDDPGNFDRVIFIPQGLTFADVIKAMRKKFNVSLYAEKLDKDVTENVRTPNKSYAIRVRRRQEADEEWKNFSANQLKQQNINCVTLMERLVDELKWYDETGEHMDVGNWTLCEGSRSSGGGVPYVGWVSDNRRLRVSWYSPGDVNGRLRARQAVSN